MAKWLYVVCLSSKASTLVTNVSSAVGQPATTCRSQENLWGPVGRGQEAVCGVLSSKASTLVTNVSSAVGQPATTCRSLGNLWRPVGRGQVAVCGVFV